MTTKLSSEAIYSVFEAFKSNKILVIGDIMLDSYIWGNVNRISPEAPVPVVLASSYESRLGGAANVALNLKSLGAEPILLSVTGTDRYADELLELLKISEISSQYIIQTSDRPTTNKLRIIGNHLQQLIRIDSETEDQISTALTNQIKKILDEILPQVDAVIFEDYDKGVLHPELIEFIIKKSNQLKIPTIVDPKKRNFHFYNNVTLFKPNLKELKEGLGILIPRPINIYRMREAAASVFSKMKIDMIMVTLSEEGIFISDYHKDALVSSHKRNIYDVSGAGDTVASVATLALANKLPIEQIAELTNIAGGLVCEDLGVVPINRIKFLNEVLSLMAE